MCAEQLKNYGLRKNANIEILHIFQMNYQGCPDSIKSSRVCSLKMKDVITISLKSRKLIGAIPFMFLQCPVD